MYELNVIELRKFILDSGLKQKTISEKSGISEVKFSMILQGKRKCDAGEYASICKALKVPPSRFIKKKPRNPDKRND